MIALLMLLDKFSSVLDRIKNQFENNKNKLNRIQEPLALENEQKLEVHIEVNYDNDFQKTEQITLQSVEELVKKKNDCIIGAEQHMHFHSFGKSSVFFTIVVYLRKGANRAIARTAFTKTLENHFMENKVVTRINVDY
jgi:small-conductance mechanosensitive channel